jgi:hypothetical protein
MGAENATHTGIQSPDYPVCSFNNLLNIGVDVTSIQRSLWQYTMYSSPVPSAEGSVNNLLMSTVLFQLLTS